MVEPLTPAVSDDPLSVFMAQRREPVMAAAEWSVLQTLDVQRAKLGRFLERLDDQEKLEYVRLQKAWIDAQSAQEKAIGQLTELFQHQALALLRSELKTLTGEEVDPTAARIHTRYLQRSDRVRRAAQDDEVVKVASITLWDAACMNYDGLTGWSYPGRTGLADASYLDPGINASAGDFIALVRRLDIGGQLKAQVDQALQPGGVLGTLMIALARAEFEFALIDAHRSGGVCRIDRQKYQCVRRALTGEVPWGRVEEMRLFIPYGIDSYSWVPQNIGLTGQYVGAPPGDSLNIPHIVFAVDGCPGAFSFFPNRPGGAMRHHDSHRKACEEFHVHFQAFYRLGEVDWLYQMMALRDCARLKKIARSTPPPRNLQGFAKLIHSLAQSIPRIDGIKSIGYVRDEVHKVPVVSLNDFYIERCRANLQELANETPGFMPTVIELFQTLINEILNLLLIPVPGALKGLGRVRAFAMFVALEQSFREGAYQALQGESGELLQGFTDLADLLISGRLHTRLALSVQRRHQRLHRRLAQMPGAVAAPQSLTSPQLLERMLGSQEAPARQLEALLETSSTSREVLNRVWDGAPPSASLVEAVQRFRADTLIEWVAGGADLTAPVPVGAVDVMAPLLTQLERWPVDTSLSIRNAQGLEIRRYSKDGGQPTTQTVSVSVLENYQFAYAEPRRLSVHLPQAIEALLPDIFAADGPTLRQQLAALAQAVKVDLFDALTQFADATRAQAEGAAASVRRLLPDSVGDDPAVPAVITQLQALHPGLSRARLLDVLREHPLSEHQQTQLLFSQLQPEALYNALRAARQVARRETLIDGLFNPRRFDRQTQRWVAQLAPDLVRDLTGQGLVVCGADQAVPYVSKGPWDRTIVVIDQRRGRFSVFDHRTSRTGAVLAGVDSFYEAVVSQLTERNLLRLGQNASQAISELRYRVARTLLRNRAPQGAFFLGRREIAAYASTAPLELSEPDALGLYPSQTDHYVFIEGMSFKVDQAGPLQPWRIRHPSLINAYAPLLTHNGVGAWRHEWENPLTWDGQQPFYRLGPRVRGFSPDAIEQIQQISGVTAAMLRRVHVRNERPPIMLLDTLERFNAHQRVKAGVDVGRDFFDELLGEVGPDKADALVGRAGVGRADQVTVLESKVELDQAQMERLFFKTLTHKSALSSEPLGQVIQRDFPALTAAVVDDMVRAATAMERQSLEAGRVPLSMMRTVRWWLRYLRKNRAIEGVYLSAAMNEDSARLILHTLPDIQGWPGDLRVEVWERGRLIDSIGPVDTTQVRVLEPIAAQYQAYIPGGKDGGQPTGDPGAFLAVLLDLLTPAEREAFGYAHPGAIEELTAQIGHRLTRHGAFADTLLEISRHPWYNPPRRLADGRIGYPLSGGDELGPVDREQLARLRQLFPAKTDRQALELLENLSDSVRERDQAIGFLFKEREVMDNALERWRARGVITEQAARHEAAERIRRCWRKEDSSRGVPYELNLDDLALNDLPQLGAYFGHVKVMSLKSNQLTTVPSGFLRCFPQVRWILLDHNHLEHLPLGLAQLRYLSLLNLSSNRIKPRLGDVTLLSELTSLVKLDLSNNPLRLGQHLNLYPLVNLRVLNLRNTQLEHLPRGAVTLRALEVFDLRDNRISVLTSHDLYLFANVHRGMNLHGNPLSQGSLQLLRRYRDQPGQSDIYFGLNGDLASARARPDRWLAVLSVSEVPRHQTLWEQLQQRPMSEHFFALLNNIADYPLLTTPGYRALREDLTRRVWQLIESANENELLALTLFQHRFEHHRGADGWLLSLNDLELKFLPIQLLARAPGAQAAPVLNCFRAWHRLKAIEAIVLRADPEQSWRLASSRMLACRIALSASLDLPLGFHERLDRALQIPDLGAFATMRQRVMAAHAQHDWPALLAQEEYWVQFLERNHRARFEARLGQYDRELEEALAQVESGEMAEGDYLLRASSVQVSRASAANTLIAQLTGEEWQRFTSG
ncbi:NEL-type E3 ubiquitin ligase domain-containing protein [Pseudomonas sp. FP2309]|uniref:NEL-type E3 ubiquitin ligase domain-containing protein n=1 Tax=Pseudomonas sp. FP2309 TaxID=2954091 RepID=UPI002732AD2F|nr:NEL-type E3 ubiquitin ligase domain-containing protein [Pseudomonas sp. FP2309]WLH67091.1 NEL-type E3 ubiquitin ligase domain-containing protein [Pseudomonas sp. FP2309]